MSRRTRLFIFAVAWLIVLMPFLFWRSTWFGLALSDEKISQYLRDDQKPRHIQHALVQIGERLARGQDVSRWYPELVRLSQHPVEEIRTTDAWLMGEAQPRPEFRDALYAMLEDDSTAVRNNAALSLVSYGDDFGHDQIVSMLRPAIVRAPGAGRAAAVAKAGEPIRRGTLLAKIDAAGEDIEVRTPISGRIESVSVRAGSEMAEGQEIAVITPGAEQIWEALRALFLIGRMEDLDVVRRYTYPAKDLPQRIQQQAIETEKAIVARAGE